MSKKAKSTSIHSYFAKQRRKESTEIKEHRREMNKILRSLPVRTSTSQSTEFDSAEERINLKKPNIASSDIAKILPCKRSSNGDKLHLLKNAFRPVG